MKRKNKKVNNFLFVAYTEIMEKIVVSEREENSRNIMYIAKALSPVREHSAKIEFRGGRVSLTVETLKESLRRITEQKTADVICIGYKYRYLKERIHIYGLSERDYEILLAAVVAADYEDDKDYVLSGLHRLGELTIDGFFDFRLKALREKWDEIAQCVPSAFTSLQLNDFVRFLSETGTGKVFLKDGEVFDLHCRKLCRTSLLEDVGDESDALREIVLSGAVKVECLSALSSEQEMFLRRFYGNRVIFAGQ